MFILTIGSFNFNFSKNSFFILNNLKFLFIITSIISKLILIYSFSFFIKPNKLITTKNTHQTKNLSVLIGINSEKKSIFIPEKGLYQNILITGSIGSGKTSSLMYPLTKQLISYKHSINNEKLGMLILDVKGNYYSKVKQFVKLYNRESDLISISLNNLITYNPLDNINLKPSVLANRLKTILLLFSPNNSESYWLDKSEAIITEAIKLCRLYNNNYVNFLEIHKIITDYSYFTSKINFLREKFLLNQLTPNEISDFNSIINFFNNEYYTLDSRTFNILKSEITRITNIFVSDSDIIRTFSPDKNKNTFIGFDKCIETGKIVVLNMNINEYHNLSKIIATYLKLDFQHSVLKRLSHSLNIKPVVFISDEYSEYVSATDANFFSQSREAKCINIISTQSYTSILNTLNNRSSTDVIIQSLINKFWFRSDDLYTINEAQKLLGKTEFKKISRTISENSKEISFNIFTHSLNSKTPNISESENTYFQKDFTFDSHFFTQELNTFECLSFISTGNTILKPCKIQTIPIFRSKEVL